VSNPTGKHSPKYVSIDRAEKIDDVRFKVVFVSPGYEVMYMANRWLDPASLDEGETATQIELPKNGFYKDCERFHYNAVAYAGNL
jgi:hypothetical protein